MAVRIRGGRSSWPVRGVELLGLAAWAGLAYVVLELEPGDLASRLAFFAALGLALCVSFGLAAYALSFSLFSDERYRGNLGRSLQQGAIAAGVSVAAAALQGSRLLTPLVGLALLAIFLAGQTAVLLRR